MRKLIGKIPSPLRPRKSPASFGENWVRAEELQKGCITSPPSGLRSRKTRQSTRVPQPCFPKDGSATNQAPRGAFTLVRLSGQSGMCSPLSWHVSWITYRPGRVPARACRYHQPDHSLPPHPTSLPKVNTGGEGIQQTHNLQSEPKTAFLLPNF